MLSSVLRKLRGVLPFVGLVVGISNPVYVITNAEQPSLFRPGLTPVGLQRATECLPAVGPILFFLLLHTHPELRSCFQL